MSKATLNHYYPTNVSPPGETLLEMIEEAGLTPESFADLVNLDHEKIIALLKGKAPLTEEIALQLEENFKVSAEFWTRREQHYRLSLEQRKSRYQEEIEFCYRVGEISVVGRRILEHLRSELSLSPEDARNIEIDVQNNLEYRQNLRKYEQAFQEAIQIGFNDEIYEDLSHFKDILSLKDQDVEAIEETISDRINPNLPNQSNNQVSGAFKIDSNRVLDDLTVPHMPKPIQKTRPKAVSIHGERMLVNPSNWRRLTKIVTEWVVKNRSDSFEILRQEFGDNQFSSTPQPFPSRPDQMGNDWYRLTNDIYVNVNKSALESRNFCQRLLNIVGISDNDWSIET